jgi:alkylhydroperoxidase family enzyme
MTPRIPPVPEDQRDDATQELLATTAGVGGGRILNIFATFVRHPRLFKRWAAFGGQLLMAGRLPGRHRELLVLRTAHNTDAPYEWTQHVAIGKAAGLTDEEIERVTKGPDAGGWEPFERTLLVAADELHDHSRISDGTWAELAAGYDEQQLIEVCMLVGNYHLVAFTLNSLGVELEG